MTQCPGELVNYHEESGHFGLLREDVSIVTSMGSFVKLCTVSD